MNDEQRGRSRKHMRRSCTSRMQTVWRFPISPQNPRFTNALVGMILAVLVDGGTLGLSLLKGKRRPPAVRQGAGGLLQREAGLTLNVFLHKKPGYTGEPGFVYGFWRVLCGKLKCHRGYDPIVSGKI